MATRKIVPRADNEGGIGTALKRWASAFIAGITVNTINLLDGQISFPATQAPSEDPNTLDDYEEGTWTPAITFGGASVGITYVKQSGYYIKLGSMVFLTGIIQFSSKGSSVGTAMLVGLPFTVKNADSGFSAVTLYLENISFANQFQGFTKINDTKIYLVEITEAGAPTVLTAADFSDVSQVVLSLHYPV